MSENKSSPLEYHYQTGLKLGYFILSADIALLGWTVTNTDWLPSGILFVSLISIFWILIIASLITGVMRQQYNGMLFGVNQQYLDAGELANQIERSALDGGSVLDQRTKEVIPNGEFSKYAEKHRQSEKDGMNVYKELNKKSTFFARSSFYLLILGLIFLIATRIISLIYI